VEKAFTLVLSQTIFQTKVSAPIAAAAAIII
jgi:hypothetical protein